MYKRQPPRLMRTYFLFKALATDRAMDAVSYTHLDVYKRQGILSVMMSTADSYLLVSVQTFVHDLGKNFMPEMTEKHEILMSRVMSVVLDVYKRQS